MPVDAPPELASFDVPVVVIPSPGACSKRQAVVRSGTRQAVVQIVLGCVGFLAIWALFYQIWTTFPYVSSGSDVVFRTKVRAQRRGDVFRGALPGQKKLLIFGTSKILSGFRPDQFDETCARRGFPFSASTPVIRRVIPSCRNSKQ
jgi:hypothetical protein